MASTAPSGVAAARLALVCTGAAHADAIEALEKAFDAELVRHFRRLDSATPPRS
jgi:hypothetical protein